MVASHGQTITRKVRSCTTTSRQQNLLWSKHPGLHLDYADPFLGVIVDAYSKWIDAQMVSNTTS